MDKYRLLCIMFVVAACCFFAGAINHYYTNAGGVLSSVLIGLGCLCFAYAAYSSKRKK